VTKTQTIFPNEDACLELVFLAIQDIEKGGTRKSVTGEKSTPSWSSILKNGLRGLTG
jgi:transposase-like protein